MRNRKKLLRSYSKTKKTSQKRSSLTGPRPASRGKQNTSVTRAPFFLRCSFPEISCSTHYTFRKRLLRSCSSCHAGLPQSMTKHALRAGLLTPVYKTSAVSIRYSSRLSKNETLILVRFLRVVKPLHHAHGCHGHSHERS